MVIQRVTRDKERLAAVKVDVEEGYMLGQDDE